MKIALVTGGIRGIVRAICEELHKKGYYGLINDVSNDAAAADCLQAIEGQGELLKFDVGNPEAVKEALAQWQKAHPDDYIEVLVNNAGIRKDNLLIWLEPDEWRKVIDTNLNSWYYTTRAVLQPMLVHKYGRVVNVASLSGIKGLPGQTNYSAAKGGLIAATKALAQEVARKNVTVNAVAPGFIKTDMVDGLDEAALKKDIPAARFGNPEEVAAVVGFLASREASYVTGEVISINGGLYT
jgi:3-oxoacyl-[acyl-carrier protein] reductase